MVITVTPVPPSAPLPGDKGQFQDQSGWARCACYGSSSLCEQMPVTSRQLLATILSATFYTFIYVLKIIIIILKKPLDKQEKPNLGISTRFSLCSITPSEKPTSLVRKLVQSKGTNWRQLQNEEKATLSPSTWQKTYPMLFHFDALS